MRILLLSNFYPPHFIGGYELGCREVVEGLRARGYELLVVTSTYGVSAETAPEPGVLRRLYLRNSPGDPPRNFRAIGEHNLKEFRTAVSNFHPDIIYAWNLDSLGAPLIDEIETGRRPQAYYVSDLWMLGATGRVPPWLECKPKRQFQRQIDAIFLRAFLRLSGNQMPRKFTNLQCCSRFVFDKINSLDAAQGDCEVIYWGVRLEKFASSTHRRENPFRLLYVGQLERHKGVHTAVRAFSIIQQEIPAARLTIVGGSLDGFYGKELRQLARRGTGSTAISFRGRVAPRELRDIFSEHDILLFPSEWDEPFALTPLEAMAAGLAVVATSTGGSAEIFENGVNSLIFRAGDYEDCARQTERLLKDPDLFKRMVCVGHKEVTEKFALDGMLDRIERHLMRIVQMKQNLEVVS